jgi:hypothetical protein
MGQLMRPVRFEVCILVRGLSLILCHTCIIIKVCVINYPVSKYIISSAVKTKPLAEDSEHAFILGPYLLQLRTITNSIYNNNDAEQLTHFNLNKSAEIIQADAP